ncbi:C25 family cysteine peptidase [Candidatus Eisenbacteria bacterium]|uniref:C25 family cysteine peptidase n=1 Tax=Eiseniibacteriota bacterium TaxID=2212470 RepID=A0ABV6YNG5_UNCEI
MRLKAAAIAGWMMFLAASGMAHGHVMLQGGGGSEVNILFEAGQVRPVRSEMGRWLGVRLEGFAALLDDSLLLEVPVRSYLIGIPEGANVTYDVIGGTSSRIERYESESVLTALGDALEDLPREPATVAPIGYLKRQRVAGLRITPLTYDDATGDLVLHTGFRVRVGLAGAVETGGAGASLAGGETDDAFYRHAILNHEQAKPWRVPLQRAALQGDYFTSSTNWIKAEIDSSGIYCVTGADLSALGISLGGIDPSTLRAYSGGGLPLRETLAQHNPDWMRLVPIKVEDGGDGSFDPADCIIFYALNVNDWADFYDRELGPEDHNESFFSNYNYYWLSWGGSFNELPLRMEEVELPACDGCSYYQPQSFYERIHTEINSIVDFSIYADDAWYWRILNIGNVATLEAKTPFPDLDSLAVLKVRVADPHSIRGFPPQCPGAYYSVITRLNSAALQDTTWFAAYTAQNVIDIYGQGALVGGERQIVEVFLPRDPPPPYEDNTICSIKPYLAWFDIYYWREFEADGGKLFFLSPDTTDTVKYEVGGFSSSPEYAFDVTDQFGVKELTGFDVTGSADFTATLFDTVSQGERRRYALTTRDALMSPRGLVRADISNIRYAGENKPYIVITHEDLLPAANTLADYRSAEVITVDEIYDEFGWGLPDVTAIRDFLRLRYETYPLDRVLMLGKATWDYKQLRTAESFPNYVPSYERRYLPPARDPYNTDDWFVYFVPKEGDSAAYFPTIPVSRLAPVSPEDADFVVQNAIQYTSNPELGPWQNSVILVADDDRIPEGCELGSPHTRDADLMGTDHYPPVFERTKIYLTEYPVSFGLKPAAKNDFVAALNKGALFSNYVGHGDPLRMAQEEVFNPGAISLVYAGRRLSFLIAASCNVSKFDEPNLMSMAERLVVRREGGTIGSLASTQLCLPRPNRILNGNFISALFEGRKKYPTIPISDGAAIGKALTVAADHSNTYWRNNEKYAVFGEAGLELAVPKLDVVFETDKPDTVKRHQTYEYSLRIEEGGILLSGYDGQTAICASEADDTTGYQSCDPSNFMDYSLPGATIFRGKAQAENGRLDFAYFVGSSTREGTRGTIRCFTSDGTVSGSGLLDSLLISGVVAAEDDEGPVIGLRSGGNVLEPGDTVTVGQQIEVMLSDQSGVAVKGKSEAFPSVSVAFDDVERIALADSMYASGSDFTQSLTTFVVPGMASGVHKFSVTAFDNLNNSSTQDYDLLVGLDDAGAGNVVYVYPNPSPGTCFIVWEYENDDYVEIEATIYTLSGRRIWTGSTSGRGSYHLIEWDGTDLVGDTVANGTYLVVVEASAPSDPAFGTSDKIAVVRAR